MSRTRQFIALSLWAFLVLGLLANESAAAESPSKNWRVEPFVSGGVVFEFLSYQSYFRGGGVSLQYKPGSWSARARYRLDAYNMSYFGTTSETASNITSGDLDSAFLDRVDVTELREDLLVDVGFQVRDRLRLAPGVRWIQFDNDFSSFTFLGPALGGDWTLPWRTYRIILELDWAANLFGSVSNHQDEFVVFDDLDTISYYGEPRFQTDWRILFGFQPLRWLGVAVGYEGSATMFEGIYRYANGATLRAEF